MDSDFKMDWDRIARTGTAEAVLCDGKSARQIDAIVAHAQRAQPPTAPDAPRRRELQDAGVA